MTVTPFHDKHSLGPVDCSLFLVVYLSNICIERFQVPKIDVLTYDTAAKGKPNIHTLYTYIYILLYYSKLQTQVPWIPLVSIPGSVSLCIFKKLLPFFKLTNILLLIMQPFISWPAPTGLQRFLYDFPQVKGEITSPVSHFYHHTWR